MLENKKEKKANARVISIILQMRQASTVKGPSQITRAEQL